MKLSHLRRSLLPVTVTLVAVVALAACGGSSSKTSTKSSSSSSSTTKAAATTNAVIKTADNASLGTILVDANGKTVYTLTNNGAAVACTGGCLTAWPPVLLPAGTTNAAGGAGVTGLAVVTVAGGTQVTSKGLPLYTFSGDAAAGDANGDGLASFGGTWHVVTIKKATVATSSTTTRSGY